MGRLGCHGLGVVSILRKMNTKEDGWSHDKWSIQVAFVMELKRGLKEREAVQAPAHSLPGFFLSSLKMEKGALTACANPRAVQRVQRCRRPTRTQSRAKPIRGFGNAQTPRGGPNPPITPPLTAGPSSTSWHFGSWAKSMEEVVFLEDPKPNGMLTLSARNATMGCR